MKMSIARVGTSNLFELSLYVCCRRHHHVSRRHLFTGFRHKWLGSRLLCQHEIHGKTNNNSPRQYSQGAILIGRHVREALANRSPIVALESTVITHGLPEPHNLELALKLEQSISAGHWWRTPLTKDNSSSSTSCRYEQLAVHSDEQPHMSGVVTPATVGIIKGQLVVGLSRDELEYLANKELSKPVKASRRDIPLAQAARLSAGTTVSATMALASSVVVGERQACSQSSAISVFATGGLGGVHRGGELSMDVSADLYEMARTRMGLVSSGFKSFLDTRRSLELLESLGCTVCSLREFDINKYEAARVMNELGDTTHSPSGALFPGFFTRHNHERIASPWQCASVLEAARVLFHCLQPTRTTTTTFDDARAMLLACPIPKEFCLEHSSQLNGNDDGNIELVMRQVSDSIEKRLDLIGNERTPLILAELNRRSGGRTLAANLALLENNARIGAHLAYEYHKLLCQSNVYPSSTFTTELNEQDSKHKPSDQQAEDDNHKLTERQEERARPVVIGCTMIDMHVRTQIDDKFKNNAHYSGVTFAGQPHLTLGGVGRNLATALELLGHEPLFITSLANDNLADFALNEMRKFSCFNCSTTPTNGMAESSRLKVLRYEHEPSSSSCFALVLVDSITGQCEYVIANLDARHAISASELTAKRLDQHIKRAPLVVLDANLTSQTLQHLFEICYKNQVPVFVEPTDVACLPSLVEAIQKGAANLSSAAIQVLSPNAVELLELVRLFEEQACKQDVLTHQSLDTQPPIEQLQKAAEKLMQNYMSHLKCLLVTMDKRGVLVAVRVPQLGLSSIVDIDKVNVMQVFSQDANQQVIFKHYPPDEIIAQPVSASGAGDSFAAGFASGLLEQLDLISCMRRAFAASRHALQHSDTVPMSLQTIVQDNTKNSNLDKNKK